MKLSGTSTGLLAALLASASFGTSGVLAKPLMESGWSPVATVTLRALGGGLLLLPVALVSMRGRWSSLWRARSRVLVMGVVGVAFTQLAYFAAIRTVPVSTALLVEFLAPLLLVGLTWARTRRTPQRTVLAGSVLALAGLLLVIGPGAIRSVDLVGLLFAFGAAAGCATYFAVAARSGDGLPPVALAASGLLVGGVLLGAVGAGGLLAFTVRGGDLPMFGSPVVWWVPLLLLALVSTAFAYAMGITGSELLGSRLASFVGLLEVAFAALFAWLLLGERLTVLQLLGGVLILAGITAVRAERVTEPEGQVAELAEPAAVEPVKVPVALDHLHSKAR
ncbi:EamA family transporter [Kineosporia sp. J2-2]|uniref:EamA family transporter n=1 Tax=Kineosporia corallincola TaxID=2835133 RepID=A0ABS5TG09_9ACTN|nr:DMT family transporter [Kineosporia corallincola]MBT0770030.1 EamA family transporter [Kineosporia corallincola]